MLYVCTFPFTIFGGCAIKKKKRKKCAQTHIQSFMLTQSEGERMRVTSNILAFGCGSWTEYVCVGYVSTCIQKSVRCILLLEICFNFTSLSYASLQCKYLAYLVALCNGSYDYDNMVLYAHLPSLSPLVRCKYRTNEAFLPVYLFVSSCTPYCISFWLYYMHFNFVSSHWIFDTCKHTYTKANSRRIGARFV